VSALICVGWLFGLPLLLWLGMIVTDLAVNSGTDFPADDTEEQG
jgi:hypothetical protein